MKTGGGKINIKALGEENEKMMKELEKIQQNIESQEALLQGFEKENQKLKMLQNLGSVFNKTQTSKDSIVITQIINELKDLKAQISLEVQEITKLRKEKQELTSKLAIVDQELSTIKSSANDTSRKLVREKSMKDFPIKFS